MPIYRSRYRKTRRRGLRRHKKTKRINNRGGTETIAKPAIAKKPDVAKKPALTKEAAFVKAQCAPKDKEILKYSCYNEKALIKMRNLWNTRHTDDPINSDIPRDIWANLKKRMENACKSEACWLNQKFMENNLDSELLTYTFAPKSPEKWKENHNTWLNSTDIEKVMKQYEHTYPCFRFIGPTPIDFDKKLYDKKCVWDDLCQFDLESYIGKGVSKIGIIFNTDPHTKGGAHWISLFINLKKGFIFFFDSNGTKIPNEILTFANRVIDQANKLKIKLTFDQNSPFAHQESNTECGMYSLYFIITLLKDKHPIDFFKTTKISDKEMEHMRDKYFNITL